MRIARVLVGLLLGFFLLFPLSAFAQTPPTRVVLPETQTVNNNYFGTGQSVDLEGTVNGDAYLAGGTVLVNGTVHGDVLAAGGQITIKGNVQNVRVAGGQVVIDGKVNGNVTVAGGSVTITSGSVVAGSVVGAGGQVIVSGPVGKTITIGAGQLTVGNTVGSDATVAAGQLTLSSSAKVHGNLWYQSQQQAQIDKGASVSGKVTHAYPPQQEKQPQTAAAFAGISLLGSLAMFVLELVIGLILLSLVPNYSQRVVQTVREHFWLSFGIGILAWVLTPILVLLLLLTLIGIPLAIVAIFSVAIFTYIGRLYAALFVGNWAMQYTTKQKRLNQYAALIVGLIIFEIVSWIPLLGWLFVAFMSAAGFGTVLMLEKIYYTELRAKKIL